MALIRLTPKSTDTGAIQSVFIYDQHATAYYRVGAISKENTYLETVTKENLP